MSDYLWPALSAAWQIASNDSHRKIHAVTKSLKKAAC